MKKDWKEIRNDRTGIEFNNIKTKEILACRSFDTPLKWFCVTGKSWYGGGLTKNYKEMKTKKEAMIYAKSLMKQL